MAQARRFAFGGGNANSDAPRFYLGCDAGLIMCYRNRDHHDEEPRQISSWAASDR
jgi:hypothetical protein